MKYKEDVSDLAYIRRRFAIACEALRDIQLEGASLANAECALLALEHEEVAERIEAQGRIRVRHVQRFGKMLEVIRAFKEHDHDVFQQFLQKNTLLELKLRKYISRRQIEPRNHNLPVAPGLQRLASNRGPEIQETQLHFNTAMSIASTKNTALRANAAAFIPDPYRLWSHIIFYVTYLHVYGSTRPLSGILFLRRGKSPFVWHYEAVYQSWYFWVCTKESDSSSRVL